MREGGFHFKVAPGRCDPPWVTLAESDLVFPFHARARPSPSRKDFSYESSYDCFELGLSELLVDLVQNGKQIGCCAEDEMGACCSKLLFDYAQPLD